MKQHKHKKRFGQNFLNNQKIIDRIIAAIRPRSEQHMVEIGPGEAALTQPLLEIVNRLEIIEIDNDLIGPLTARFGDMAAFNLHHTDALSFDYSSLINEQEKPKSLRIVGNLPYNISSPLMFHLLTFSTQIRDMHFMLQKEVVDRITSLPGSKTYGRLSVMMQYACEVESLFEVTPDNFTPPPKVTSAIIRLVPFAQKPFIAQCETSFAKIVKQSFSQKRKTLRNNLKGFLSTQQIESLGIDPAIRSERLTVAQFVQLADLLYLTTQNENA